MIEEPTTTTTQEIGSTIDPELLLVKKQRAALLRKKVEALKNDSLPLYVPHPKQDAFHRSTALRRGAFTGNRFGKSTMGIAEDCAWLRNERPWYPKSDVARTSAIPQRPVKGLIIVNDWDKVKELFTGQDGKLWKFLPADGFIKSCTRNHSGAVDTIHCANRSSLRFDTVKSFMSNPQGSESSDWDFIHVDEPCPEPMFKAAARGLIDRNGAAWFTLTALCEPWITDAFEPNGVFAFSMFSIDGAIYDNPYLSSEAIGAYESTLTEDEKDCRLRGIPLHKSGLIYKEFQRDRHVLTELPRGWRSFIEPPDSWSYYAYIDPHPHTPHMVLFLVVDPTGRKYVFADLFEKCLIRELCLRIRTLMGSRRFVRVRCDPIAYTEDPINGTRMADEFWLHGVHVEKASKDLARGILRVKEELADRSNPPKIVFTPDCRRTIWEIGRYHWDEETGKPVDKDDHAMECFYRAILDEPCYVDPQSLGRPVPQIDFDRLPRQALREEEPLGWKEVTLSRDDLMLA